MLARAGAVADKLDTAVTATEGVVKVSTGDVSGFVDLAAASLGVIPGGGKPATPEPNLNPPNTLVPLGTSRDTTLVPDMDSSPGISPADITDKTPEQLRELAASRALVPHATKPDKFMDPFTGKERLRLDQGHIDKDTGLPYSDPRAAVPHAHGYGTDGKTKVRDPVDGNPHFPTR